MQVSEYFLHYWHCTQLIAENWECSNINIKKSNRKKKHEQSGDHTGFKQTSRLDKLIRKKKWRLMVKLFDKTISVQGPFSSCSGALDYTTQSSSPDGVCHWTEDVEISIFLST